MFDTGRFGVLGAGFVTIPSVAAASPTGAVGSDFAPTIESALAPSNLLNENTDPLLPLVAAQNQNASTYALAEKNGEKIGGSQFPLSARPSTPPLFLQNDSLHKFLRWVKPPVVDPPYLSIGHENLYHGTSLDNLIALVRLGGTMPAGISYFSDNQSFSIGYAKVNARKQRSIGFVMQFPKESLKARLETGHFQPVYTTGRSMPVQPANYFVSNQLILLSEQTEESKQMILQWVVEQRNTNKDHSADWNAILSELIFAMKPLTIPT